MESGPQKKIIQEIRKQEEEKAYITDSGIEKYSEFLGIDFTKMQGKLVLDIGSGKNEKFSKQATQYGIKVVSMAPHLKDGTFSDEFLSDWQKRSVAGRGQEMPFASNTFDSEVALFSVPFYLPLDNPEECSLLFREVIRTLKPGGQAYFLPIFSGEADEATSRNYISCEAVSKILDKFSDLADYTLDQLPHYIESEYRLVITKK